MTPAGLVLDAAPDKGVWTGPDGPCAILPGVFKPLAFADLRALGRYVQRERRGRDMRLARVSASYNCSDTFQGFAVYLGEPGSQTDRYAFTLAGVGDVRVRVEAAIRDAHHPA